MTPRLPRLLDDADQKLSDRAVDAATAADHELRAQAHAQAAAHAPEDGERPYYYAAYLLLAADGDLVRPDFGDRMYTLAADLHDIHRRHQAAIAARSEAD